MRVSRKAIGYDQWASRQLNRSLVFHIEPRPEPTNFTTARLEPTPFTAALGIGLILLSMLLAFLTWRPTVKSDPWAEADHNYRERLATWNAHRNDHHIELKPDTTPEEFLFGKQPNFLTPP